MAGCDRLHPWLTHGSWSAEFPSASSSTATPTAMRIRSKSRYLALSSGKQKLGREDRGGPGLSVVAAPDATAHRDETLPCGQGNGTSRPPRRRPDRRLGISIDEAAVASGNAYPGFAHLGSCFR